MGEGVACADVVILAELSRLFGYGVGWWAGGNERCYLGAFGLATSEGVGGACDPLTTQYLALGVNVTRVILMYARGDMSWRE